MNDFQEQAKNWLRNVVKQNPDKIKAGVEKAGDLVDKQTGGKYAEKVDAVQQKVGGLVDSHASEGTSAEAPSAADQASEAGAGGVASAGGGGAPEAEVVGGETPDPASQPDSSVGSGTEGAGAGGTGTGSTATGQADVGTEPPLESEGELPGPRP
ncbi:antitoxin [Kribbella sp. CWNU-51]